MNVNRSAAFVPLVNTPAEGTGLVVQHGEIGLTRFIVCNAFVVSFVATRNIRRGFAGDVPAGYFSEDVTLIKRFKQAFDDYWSELPTLQGQRAERRRKIREMQEHLARCRETKANVEEANAELVRKNADLAAQLQVFQKEIDQLRQSLLQGPALDSKATGADSARTT